MLIRTYLLVSAFPGKQRKLKLELQLQLELEHPLGALSRVGWNAVSDVLLFSLGVILRRDDVMRCGVVVVGWRGWKMPSGRDGSAVLCVGEGGAVCGVSSPSRSVLEERGSERYQPRNGVLI